MHNKGLIDENYGTDGIPVNGRKPLIDPVYKQFLQNRQKPYPMVLGPEHFDNFSMSHIELLHHLHDAIQRKYFNQKTGYSYARQGKPIEWRRILVAT